MSKQETTKPCYISPGFCQCLSLIFAGFPIWQPQLPKYLHYHNKKRCRVICRAQWLVTVAVLLFHIGALTRMMSSNTE